MIHRQAHLDQIALGLRQFPVLALLGPRQVGKTTLARQIAAQWIGPSHHCSVSTILAGAVVVVGFARRGEAWPLAEGISALPLNALHSVNVTA